MTLRDLLDLARTNRWCTKPHCTTCGSTQFRTALENFSRDELIEQLRQLDASYFHDRNPILMIIYRASVFPMAGDLIEPLGDSPAGRFLRKAIEIQEGRNENRSKQEEMSTLEAIEARQSLRKEKRRLATEPHRQRKANKTLSEMNSNAHGAIYGALVGDAAGASLEFLGRIPEPDEVERALQMVGGGCWGTAPGQITDDGEMTIACLRAIAGHNTYPIDAVARNYIDWASSSPFDIGMTTRNALEFFTALPEGMHAQSVMQQANRLNMNSKANGALMRASVIGAWSSRVSLNNAIQAAKHDTALTHPNKSCQNATAAYVAAIRHLILHTGDAEGALAVAVETLMDDDAQEVAIWLDDAINGVIEPTYPNEGYVKVAFGLAFYHLMKRSTYTDALYETLLLGGDTDTNACIVGGLIGALNGLDGLPSNMLSGLLNCDTSLGQPRPDMYSTKNLPQLIIDLLGH